MELMSPLHYRYYSNQLTTEMCQSSRFYNWTIQWRFQRGKMASQPNTFHAGLGRGVLNQAYRYHLKMIKYHILVAFAWCGQIMSTISTTRAHSWKSPWCLLRNVDKLKQNMRKIWLVQTLNVKQRYRLLRKRD